MGDRMTDVLEQAKDLIKRYDESGFIHRDDTMLLPELVAKYESVLASVKAANLVIRELMERVKKDEAECERLQAENNDLVANRDAAEAHIGDMHTLRDDLMENCNQLRARSQKAEAECERLRRGNKYLGDRWAGQSATIIDMQIELTRWQKIAAKAAATANKAIETTDVDWYKMVSEEDIQEAARELGIDGIDHIREPTKMMMTTEQRAALKLLLTASDPTKIGNFDWTEENDARDVLRSMLTQSQPSWEITKERKVAIAAARIYTNCHAIRINDTKEEDHCDETNVVLRAMLEEAK